ncbi:multiubiquitin [Mucilaginibacter oryzae]|uniref:Multiubiquitin n=1 Tax=Mucilaginibacter oryzae TaxID=468058 RepID=A0A316GXD4_9SPHI|nr:multiubiquitin domain-containing protein [Mucilaginibacter oryzae]PWK68265.1 multiubiquitin [Mucilaginibacter oryzae]
MNLNIFINGKNFETHEVYFTGQQLKELAGISPGTELYLSLRRPYEDELISDDQLVDISRPEMEYFYTKKTLKFIINGHAFNWDKPYISPEEIRSYGKVDPELDLFNIQMPDQPLANRGRIDLEQLKSAEFISKKREFNQTLIINGRSKPWKEDLISFDQVIIIAFGKIDQSMTRAYTVTYSRGVESKPEGIMVKGNEIRVKDKMIFNVTATDKS